MKFYTLTEEDNCEIGLIEFPSAYVLIDCYLKIPVIANSKKYYNSSANVVFKRLENVSKFDLQSIDIVLISNHLAMIGLPKIFPKLSKNVRIYCTEPTKTMGLKFMEELIYFDKSGKKQSDIAVIQQVVKKEKEITIHDDLEEEEEIEDEGEEDEGKEFLDILSYEGLYTREEIGECFEKVTTITYNQVVEIYQTLRVRALCSGFSIGSCNWIFESTFESYFYFSNSSLIKNHTQDIFIPNIFYRKKEPFNITFFNNYFNEELNYLKTPKYVMERYTAKLRELVLPRVHMISPNAMYPQGTVKIEKPKIIIIPCNFSGVIYDIIERTFTCLDDRKSIFDVYCVSPVAKFCLKYADYCNDYLSPERRNKCLHGINPFMFVKKMKQNALHVFEKLDKDFLNCFNNNITKNSIFFMGHPSLQFGNVVKLMQFFTHETMQNFNEKIYLFLIEPQYNPKEIFNTIHPTVREKLEIFNFLIDTRLTIPEMILIQKKYFQSKNIVCSSKLKKMIINYESKEKKEKKMLCNIIEYDHSNYIVNIPIKRPFEKATISNDLAKNLFPKRVKEFKVARVVGIVKEKNGKYTVNDSYDEDDFSEKKSEVLVGKITINQLLKSLQQKGYQNLKITEINYEKYEIKLLDIDTTIIFSPSETLVQSNSEINRRAIRRIITDNFYKI